MMPFSYFVVEKRPIQSFKYTGDVFQETECIYLVAE